jgi:hypothetical protein
VEIGEKLREKIDNYTPHDKSKGQALVAPDSRKHPSLSNFKKKYSTEENTTKQTCR